MSCINGKKKIITYSYLLSGNVLVYYCIVYVCSLLTIIV